MPVGSELADQAGDFSAMRQPAGLGRQPIHSRGGGYGYSFQAGVVSAGISEYQTSFRNV
jgi:hypothetical protein